MAKYLKPQTPLQHQSGDYIYPITSVDQIVTGNGERLNANLISIDLKDSVESDKVVLGTQAVPFSIQEGGTNANNAAEARENLGITPENIGAMSMELLWENASPDSAFGGQTISIDFTGFDYYEILFCVYASGGNTFVSTGMIPSNKNARLFYLTKSSSNAASGGYRDFTFSTKSFGMGIHVISSNDNNICVPYQIYGIKGVST